MATAVIVYSTGRGHTLRLAQAVAEGMRSVPEVSPTLTDTATLSPQDWQRMHDAEAIVFGCPTYMGGVAASFKAFMDDSSDYWEERRWLDKIAAGFTIGTNYSGDKLMTLQHMAVFAAQHGMIWVGQDDIGAPVEPEKEGINEDGYSQGFGATSVRDKTRMVRPGDEVTARRFAARIFHATRRWAE
ncbi:MAG: flavodoxin family protein [Nitratireductor sp.]|nr:flavodoxin family protein [Nitratireductor sp.]